MVSLRLQKEGSNCYILRSKDHRGYGEFYTGVSHSNGIGTLFYYRKGGKRKNVFLLGVTDSDLLSNWEEIIKKYLK